MKCCPIDYVRTLLIADCPVKANLAIVPLRQQRSDYSRQEPLQRREAECHRTSSISVIMPRDHFESRLNAYTIISFHDEFTGIPGLSILSLLFSFSIGC